MLMNKISESVSQYMIACFLKDLIYIYRCDDIFHNLSRWKWATQSKESSVYLHGTMGEFSLL